MTSTSFSLSLSLSDRRSLSGLLNVRQLARIDNTMRALIETNAREIGRESRIIE
jgi:hypothetical protein